MAFIPLIFTSGRHHFFLLGPRGTGKTLWSTHHYPEALRIDLLDPETLRLLSARPERLISAVIHSRLVNNPGSALWPLPAFDSLQEFVVAPR